MEIKVAAPSEHFVISMETPRRDMRLRPEIKMKARFQLSWTMLALWAMFAALWPQTLWACPMTGRVTSTLPTCQMAAQSMAAQKAPNTAVLAGVSAGKATPCTKCCHRVPVPASQDDSQPNSIFTASSHVSTTFALAAPTFEIAPFVVSFPATIQPLAAPSIAAGSRDSPPPLWSQHRASPQAGRAPPRA